MQKIEIICLACIAALVLAYIPVVASQNVTPAVGSSLAVGSSKTALTPLRVGFESSKPMNNLDVYGDKAVNALGIYKDKTYDIGAYLNTPGMFNASQRSGQRSTFAYKWGETKPVYSVGYNAPAAYGLSTPSQAGVKGLSGYPTVMLPPMV